ncbi:MAG: antibiotic biosynthesis monooxygenase [Acidimicrobiaceae bacterium]|nr:antibiotic biosynthesis monooxygenase [Acidimicrobiaceae bacterium]
MMLEHALLEIIQGRESDFEASMRAALPIIESAPNCYGAEVRHQSEDSAVYLLLVRWASIEAHLAFRATPLFEQWRALTHPFYVSAPSVTHFFDPLQR